MEGGEGARVPPAGALSWPPAGPGRACHLTYLDDTAELVQEQLVVPARVQPLLDVAVQLVHDTLHVRILVL